MPWFNTINHRGEEVAIRSVDDMNGVVDAFEARLDQLADILDGGDRAARRAAADEFDQMKGYRNRIDSDAGKVEAFAQLTSEKHYHRDLATAIRERKQP